MVALIYSIQIITLIASVLGFVLVYKQKSSRTQKLMMAVMLSLALYSYGYLLEIMSNSLLEALMAIRIEYVAISYIATWYLLFLASYLKFEINKGLKALLLIHDTMVLLLVLFVKYNNIYYKNIQFVYSGVIPHLELTPGIVYIYNVVINFLQMSIGASFIFKRYRQAETKNKKKSLRAMLLASFMPMITYAIGITKVLGDVDIVPAGMFVTMQIFIMIIMKEKIFSIAEIAYEKLVLEMDEPIIVVDNEYNVIYKNFKAKGLLRDLSADYKENLIKNVCTSNADEFRIKNRYYRKHITPLKMKGALISYLVILVDITKSKEDYVRMEELRNKADMANVAKSVFLANVSHEIRTPLNGIIGYSELLLNEENNDNVRNRAEGINVSAKMLLTIFDEILDMSRIEQGKLKLNEETYNTQSLINDIVNNATLFMNENKMELESIVSEKIPYRLYGDMGKIRQIVNSMFDCVKNYAKKGTITLSVEHSEIGDDKCMLMFVIAINDNDMDYNGIMQIYDAFTKKQNTLINDIDSKEISYSISRAYVNLLKARLKLDIIDEKKIAIKINFIQKIRDKREIGQIDYEKKKREDIQGNIRLLGGKILVVDDNKVNLNIISNYFKHFGINVDLVESGAEAIECIKNKSYDLIFLDQMMPKLDGVQTLKLIRAEEKKQNRHTIVIAFTANVISGEKEKLLAAGFDNFLPKPMRMSELASMLIRYLPKDMIIYESGDRLEDSIISSVNINIDGLDVKDAISLCDGDIKEYIDTLRITVKYSEDKINELITAYTNGDIEKYIINVHSMKSTLYMIGANKVGKLAERLEKAGKENDRKYIKNNNSILIKDYTTLISNIKEFLKDNKSMIEQEEMKSNIIDMIKEQNYEDAISMLEVLAMTKIKE